MTFKTFISHTLSNSGFGYPNSTGGFKQYDRSDYHHHPSSHGWHTKGGHGMKGGSALNALTLLAFLFFLNILQTCLRDNIAGPQTPIVVVVTNETTETNATRTKRETNINEKENKTTHGDNIKLEIMTTVNDIIEQQNHQISNRDNEITTPQQFQFLTNEDEFNDTEGNNRQAKTLVNEGQRENKQLRLTEANYIEKKGNRRNDKKISMNKADEENKTELNLIVESRSKNKHGHKKEEDIPLLQSLMWNTLETFKPGLRASVEDTICCRLVACESSRISKKLGGNVKYFINNYFNKGLEWVCTTEEQTVRRAMKIGREGKSCADEIDDCEPKNMITDIVLLIDYFIV